MITIKQVDLNELRSLLVYDEVNMILEKPSDPMEKYFVVLEGRKVLGHAILRLFPCLLAAEITEIYILTEERRQGLGDGLFRTVLNYLRIHSFHLAIIEDHKELEGFLNSMSIGKASIGDLPEKLKDILKNKEGSQWYRCKVHEFFQQKCKGEF